MKIKICDLCHRRIYCTEFSYKVYLCRFGKNGGRYEICEDCKRKIIKYVLQETKDK